MAQLEFAARLAVQSLVCWKGPLTEITIKVNGTPPLLVSVTVCALESCPTTVAAKVSVVGEIASVGAASPVPLNATLWVPGASVKVSVPVAAPVCAGVKVTVKLQELFAGTELPHASLAIVNGPVRPLVKEMAVDPLFVAVTCCAVEVAPTCQPPKERVEGLRLSTPEAAPVPLSETVTVPPATLALIVRSPVRLPVCVGVNVT